MAHNDLAFLYLCFICFLSVLLIYHGLFWFTFSNHSIDFPRYHSIPVSILYLLPSCLLSVFCTKCEFHKGLCLFCLIHKTPHWCLGHISWIYEWMNKWIGILIWNRGKKKKTRMDNVSRAWIWHNTSWVQIPGLSLTSWVDLEEKYLTSLCFTF